MVKMRISGLQILVIASLGLVVYCSCSINATTVEYDSNAIIINGERKLIFAGAIHYPRSTSEMWPDLINKAKEGGLNAIETYIFWDQHEPRRRQYDFSGNLDFIRFFKVVQEAGLYVILRIGPYVCAEWNYGGFPMWLHNTPGIELRTNNEIYKNEMHFFTTKIVNMCKEAKLFAPQGGPIILAQIENEYGNIMKGYGEAGKEYIKWCAKMAVAQNIGVPWIMCQQKDAPQPMINTCNGFYCENFTPNSPRSPKMFTENWTGWFKKWGGKDPYRPAEDLAFSVARFFQTGGVLNNYYMYHGGTNFGRTAGGPYYVTSYDYNAPLDEYGNLNQPKWGHLKQLHEAIKLGEKLLTTSKGMTKQLGNGVDLTTYANNATGERFCFLSNADEKVDANIDLQKDGKYFVPAWSVSILRNCNKEIYNTAKITAQTSLMIKTQPELFTAFSEDPPKFNWTWAPEPMTDALQGKGTFRASELLDQKAATVDTSDYLWYMTRVNINETSVKNVTLHVTTRGHVLHAYVNDKLIGSQFSKEANSAQTVKGDDYSFVFERPVSLKSGTNTIALLSATVGLANYGEFFDKKPTGIAGGPVKLVVNGSTAMDLSSNVWSYKVGLNGEAKRFYDPKSGNQWKPLGSLPTGQPMIWYKTSFKTPIGILPVVLDFQGMGKGHAWVNGKSIGRYWPTQIADAKGCSHKCDYRGRYNGDKCVTNCGNPSQRWYHVPRSFLNNGTNTLVLFEEVGGNPSNVTTEIVKVATVCGVAEEGTTMELACQETQAISQIGLASFQNPQGTCGTFSGGSMQDSINLSQTILNECLGKSPCFFNVTEETLKVTNLGGKKLTVQAQC